MKGPTGHPLRPGSLLLACLAAQTLILGLQLSPYDFQTMVFAPFAFVQQGVDALKKSLLARVDAATVRATITSAVAAFVASLAVLIAYWNIRQSRKRGDGVTIRDLQVFLGKRDVTTITAPPGWGLFRFANWWFSPGVVQQVLEPALSDMQVEYCEALKERRFVKARWVQIRGYWRFWSHVVAIFPVSFGRVVWSLWKAIR